MRMLFLDQAVLLGGGAAWGSECSVRTHSFDFEEWDGEEGRMDLELENYPVYYFPSSKLVFLRTHTHAFLQSKGNSTAFPQERL